MKSRTKTDIIQGVRTLIDDETQPTLISDTRLNLLFSIGLTLCGITRDEVYSESEANRLIVFIVNNLNEPEIKPIQVR
jgi:hypothetical protein